MVIEITSHRNVEVVVGEGDECCGERKDEQ